MRVWVWGLFPCRLHLLPTHVLPFDQGQGITRQALLLGPHPPTNKQHKRHPPTSSTKVTHCHQPAPKDTPQNDS